MKKTAYATGALALMLAAASCAEKKPEKATAEQAETKTVKVESDSFQPTTNIRYYNMHGFLS